MKEVFAVVVLGAAFVFIMWTCLSVPVVQKSHRTGQVVACASEDTNWEMVSVVNHPACNDIKQAEVEWVK